MLKNLSLFRINYLLLFVILLIAVLLRMWRLQSIPVSLFGDELDVGYHALSILKTGKDYQGNTMPLHFHSIAEWRTPLYLYATVPTVALFGISPLGVRLPAVFFGVVSVLGIYFLVREIVNYKLKTVSQFNPHALLSAFILSINPWHLQYSRAGFEVTMLLAFLLFGVYFFFLALRVNGKYLPLSILLLTFTPWIYSTAKLFTPIMFLFLFVAFFKEIIKFPADKKYGSLLVGFLVGLPFLLSTLFGGGAERALYTSVFTDETVPVTVGTERMEDILVRGETVLNGKPTNLEKAMHNKVVIWINNITSNLLKAFSSEFLFIEGDPNLRHSIKDLGMFYKIEAIFLVLGLFLFFSGSVDVKIKSLVLFFIFFGALPSALTRDGGSHATRLILVLPFLVFIISYGILGLSKILNSTFRYIVFIPYLIIMAVSFYFYIHNYYGHYPWDSEKWWHGGMKEAIESIKAVDSSYDRVILSMAGEPMYIFFAGWYEYPPESWQINYPINNKKTIEGFGEMSYIDKFYFGNFNEPGKGIYDLGNYLDSKTLYLATAKEVSVNLILEPERTPGNLRLVKEIAYPSGDPAYYLFTGK